jgi:tetratricopeptide (TPR) repeat protein
VYYNRANVKLSIKKFHRAIDDYSMAIKLQPNLAEAYYNRALTLLYLDEIKLACKDLSKAGELGITEAYNVIKRYCNK